MTTLQTIIAISLAAIFTLPVVVYLCVKLGTFAYFRGRQAFEDRETRRKL